MNIAVFPRDRAVAIFCALAVVLSFAAYLLPLPREALAFVLVAIPTLLALALAALTEGPAGVARLLRQLGRWRVGLRWYAVAIGLGLALRLAMSLLGLALGLLPRLQLRPLSPVEFVLLALVPLLPAFLEELAWRGYALPRLLERWSPLAAGLALAVPWAAIHLALHMPGMLYAGLPPLATLLQLLGLGVILAWLYARTRSVPLAALLHLSQTFFGVVNHGLGSVEQSWLMAAVYVAAAIAITLMAGPRFARRAEDHTVVPIRARARG
ncbi:MAG: CPBP family intramembrane metalloprotease [Anaerolineales bacterium]|nr:CPBP family intramembrane metalloprotease [Anaerolineales bacterium]